MFGNGVKHGLLCLIYCINGVGENEYKIMLKGIYMPGLPRRPITLNNCYASVYMFDGPAMLRVNLPIHIYTTDHLFLTCFQT